ncbi:MAG: zinc-binding alcohol dehydrogenase family protein [Negativicutes bacterium]|nr:zinc-binding alcohol dehydrogenase family protein [Negativicutes bacterium]
MKVAVLYGPHDLRIDEKPIPALTGADSVLIKVKAVGICGSDVHAYHGKLATVTFPRVIGHEVVGEAVEVGSAVRTIQAGDHVVVDPVVSCGQCPACRAGRHNVCRDVKCIGVACEGGLAEYIVFPEASVHKLPSELAWRDAVLAEPYTIAAQVVSRGQVTADDKMLVMGAGPIGLVILQAAKRLGATVLITDLADSRLALAGRLDADVTVNPAKQDLAKAIHDFTGGYGVDVAVDAVGVPALFEQAVEFAAPAGRVVIIGFNPAAAQIPELPITRKELDIRGSRMNAGKMPEVVGWIAAGEVQTGPLVSHEYALVDLQKAFDVLDSEPEKACKIVITL